MRQPIIAGNWKMNGTRVEAEKLLQDLLAILPAATKTQVVICPPYTALATTESLLGGTHVEWGAQDLFWKEKGAYTGQISSGMLLDLGCRFVIVGHSERRGRFGVPEPDFDHRALAHFGDSDSTVNRKLIAALNAGLIPIVCVGETLSERQSGITDTLVTEQVGAALEGVTAQQITDIVFAYEPVWAIGTGEVCAADEADRICGVIRQAVGRLFGEAVADEVRVQYGGSVKPDNAVELLGKPNIDGALVGGASLKAADFAAIVAAAG